MARKRNPDHNLIKRLYPFCTASEIADFIGRSSKWVYAKAQEVGILKYRPWSPSEKQNVRQWLDVSTNREISARSPEANRKMRYRLLNRHGNCPPAQTQGSRFA